MSSHDDERLVTVERADDVGETQHAANLFNAMNEAATEAHCIADKIADERHDRQMAMLQGGDKTVDATIDVRQWDADRKPLPTPKGIVAAPTAIMPLLRERYADIDIDATNKAERTVYRLHGCGLPMVLEPKMPANSFRLILEGEQ